MILVENLSKAFGPKVAVDKVSFQVERGEVLDLERHLASSGRTARENPRRCA